MGLPVDDGKILWYYVPMNVFAEVNGRTNTENSPKMKGMTITMNERQQIIYMQTRIMRLASEKWNEPSTWTSRYL